MKYHATIAYDSNHDGNKYEKRVYAKTKLAAYASAYRVARKMVDQGIIDSFNVF